MAATSRTSQFTRLHKILKRGYTPVAPDPNRSVLEHLLFASCLENAHYRAAEEAFAALAHTFFDWNEVRVSSIRELSEVMSGLPDPAAAAHRVKRILQDLFEATYSFDLEDLRKQNIGPAVERLEKIEGTTKFSIAYVVQSALGGHSIPIDSGTAGALQLTGLAADEDLAAGVIPGLERAIPKHCGVEFGSLVHQLGADFVASPYSPALHCMLVEIEPKAKDRLPSRRGPRHPPKESPAPAPEEPDEAKGKKSDADGKTGGRAGKTGPEEKMEAVEAVPDSGPEKPAVGATEAPKEAAKEACLDPKKKPSPAKKKPPANEPSLPTIAGDPAEPPRKQEKEKSEEESALGKKKHASLKNPSPKKKPEETKGKSQADPGSEGVSLEGISKRKPR